MAWILFPTPRSPTTVSIRTPRGYDPKGTVAFLPSHKGRGLLSQSMNQRQHKLTFHFSLKLVGVDQIDEKISNQLYEAGCGDGLVSSSDGVAKIDFDREARNRQEAIESAIDNVRRAGFKTELMR